MDYTWAGKVGTEIWEMQKNTLQYIDLFLFLFVFKLLFFCMRISILFMITENYKNHLHVTVLGIEHSDT